MLTRGLKRRLDVEEMRVESESEQLEMRYRAFRRLRDLRIHRAVVKLARTPHQVCFSVNVPVPHRSMKDAWLTMLGDVCATGVKELHQKHHRLSCDRCLTDGRCVSSRRYFTEYVQNHLLLVAFGAYGSRHQMFVRACVPITVESRVSATVTSACLDRWFVIMPPTIVPHLRAIGMDTVVTHTEARALRRIFELQRHVKQRLEHGEVDADTRTELFKQLHHLCTMTNALTRANTCDAFRSELTRQVEEATYIHSTTAWGRSKMEADASRFNGIARATRRAVAQQRNMLTGADKLGVYWKV